MTHFCNWGFSLVAWDVRLVHCLPSYMVSPLKSLLYILGCFYYSCFQMAFKRPSVLVVPPFPLLSPALSCPSPFNSPVLLPLYNSLSYFPFLGISPPPLWSLASYVPPVEILNKKKLYSKGHPHTSNAAVYRMGGEDTSPIRHLTKGLAFRIRIDLKNSEH